jgi:hypothetical protein
MPLKKTSKSLGDLLRRARSEAADKPRKAQFQQPPLTFTTLSLTPAAKEILDRITERATKQAGRKVSASSVMRALLHIAEEQRLEQTLLTVIETEINTGAVVWGKARHD